MPRFTPFVNRLLTALFVLAVTIPLVATIAGVDADGTSEENRDPAPLPATPTGYASLMAWPDGFSRYFADHFAFRSTLVRWQARARVEGLGVAPTTDVLLGKEGWLYYAADGAIPDYAAADRFTTAELEIWRTTLQRTYDWLARRGIAYLFVIAPDKHTIYPEFMPDGLRRVHEQARAAQLVQYLATHSTVPVIDLTNAVRAARPQGRLFHKTDTHWNELGAFAAYQALMARLPDSLGLRARPRQDFAQRTVITPGMDLARMLGLRSVLAEEDIQLEPRAPREVRVVEPVNGGRGMMFARVLTEGPSSAPRAVIFRDSFGSALVPFLSDHFSRALYLWQNEFDPAVVLAEQPELVIQEWVARHLYTAEPYDAVAAMEAIGQQ
jgi:alginate O-acetyltransferase complex protein AlgJ